MEQGRFLAALDEAARAATLDASDYGRRHRPGGRALSEPRLHVGFVHLPVPYLTARYFPEIQAISNSADMAPWSVGGSYDRPIPRRIAEEAGVPREVLGQAKREITQPFKVYCSNLEEAMTGPAWRDLLAYQREFTAEPGPLRSLLYRVVSELEHRQYRAKKVFQHYGGPWHAPATTRPMSSDEHSTARSWRPQHFTGPPIDSSSAMELHSTERRAERPASDLDPRECSCTLASLYTPHFRQRHVMV